MGSPESSLTAKPPGSAAVSLRQSAVIIDDVASRCITAHRCSHPCALFAILRLSSIKADARVNSVWQWGFARVIYELLRPRLSMSALSFPRFTFSPTCINLFANNRPSRTNRYVIRSDRFDVFTFKKHTPEAQIESPGSLEAFRWRHFCGRPIEHRAAHKRSSVLGRVAVTSGFKADDPSRECRAVSSQRRLPTYIYFGMCVPISLECPHVARACAALLDARRLSALDWLLERDALEDRHRDAASGRPTDRPKNN